MTERASSGGGRRVPAFAGLGRRAARGDGGARGAGGAGGAGMARVGLAALMMAALVATAGCGRAGSANAAAARGAARAADEADRGWSATQPPINRTHIFHGGVNRRGKPVGFHSRPGGQDPEGARMVRVLRPANDLGVYEAQVEITDPQAGSVRKRSTFYPDRLDHAAVVAAILNAWNHRQPGEGGERFRGPSGLGFTIEGYTLDDGSINTAYPLY